MKERVVIFGLGKLFGYSYNRLAKKYDIVALVDNSIKVLEGHEQEKIYTPDELTAVEYDRVIVTVYDLRVFEEMKKQLIRCGVEASKISMFEADNSEGEKEVLDDYKKQVVDGIAEKLHGYRLSPKTNDAGMDEINKLASRPSEFSSERSACNNEPGYTTARQIRRVLI